VIKLKKWLCVLVSLLLLSGCAQVFDLFSVYELGDEMQKIMDQRHKSLPVVKDVLETHDRVADGINAMVEPDQTKLQGFSKDIDDAKISLQEYKEGERTVLEQIPSLKKQAALLEDPEVKKLAETFLDDLENGIETEIQYLAVIEKMLDELSILIQSMQSGQEVNYDPQNYALEELDRKASTVEKAINKFYQSWGAFRSRVPEVE
jgi:hypothetical protein